ncbi:hypothetical protein GCM10023186_11350 [Hymenobacter koreensis]|uniref:Methyltransferase FkbM domain-containing protein n=2 Tax=Hymenobacter koreensis TaxID=1084523 RepID=A0ABP8IWH6_9BACT
MRHAVERAYFGKRIQAEKHPQSSWLSSYLHCLLAIGGHCVYINDTEALSEWPGLHTDGRTLRAFTRLGVSSDLQVLQQVWEHREYAAVTNYMRKHADCNGALRIIDAGANVGYTALYLGNTFPNAQIISIEPESSNFRQLSRNVTASGLANVEPLQAGLWQRRAHLEVGRDFRDHREWSFYVRESHHATDLMGYGVRQLAAERDWTCIDLLKIDIEGAERYLVETDELAAELLENTRFIAIEIHDEFNIRPRIYECLRRHGFEFFENGELTIGRNTNLTGGSGTL